MKSVHTLSVMLAAVSTLLASASWANSSTRDSMTDRDPPRLCRMFAPALLDNQGFMVACPDAREERPAATPPCASFDSPHRDGAASAARCKDDRQPLQEQGKLCPMFAPPTLDTAGFRVSC